MFSEELETSATELDSVKLNASKLEEQNKTIVREGDEQMRLNAEENNKKLR